MRDMSYPEEEELKLDAAVQIEEKKVSLTSQKLIRQGFAKNQKQAQTVLIIVFACMLAASSYFVTLSGEFTPKAKPVPRDPYVRPLPQ